MLQLRDFQREDVDFIAQSGFRCLIANAPGTGKTIVCLSCIRLAPMRLLPTLIVCPASVVRNWRKEARKWVPGVKTHLVEDTNTPLDESCDMYIISWALLAERWEELARLRPQLIIGDEIHFAKNEDALRTQAMSSLCARTPHLLLLSGTPIINEESELESIYNLFGTKRPPMIRRLLEDVAPDIPAKMRARLNVDLPEAIAARYRHANEDFEAWLEKEMHDRMEAGEAEDAAARAMAAAALVKIGYLRRILAVGKVYAAADFAARVVRAGEQLVLFAEHQNVIKKLQRCLRKQGIRFVNLLQGPTARGRRLPEAPSSGVHRVESREGGPDTDRSPPPPLCRAVLDRGRGGAGRGPNPTHRSEVPDQDLVPARPRDCRRPNRHHHRAEAAHRPTRHYGTETDRIGAKCHARVAQQHVTA